MLIEPKTECVHQNEAQQAIAHMSEIPCPDSLHLALIGQLTKDSVNKVAHPSQDGTLVGCRFGRMGPAKRRLQHNPFAPQERLQFRKPIIAITQDNASRSSQQQRHDFSIGFIGWSQTHAGQQTRLTQLYMHPKPIKGLSISMVFAIARHAPEAHTAGRTGKTAGGQRLAVHNGQVRIVADQFVTQPAPQPLFDHSQVGGLPHKGRAMRVAPGREKVRVVTSEIIEEFLILAEFQITCDHFDGQDFTIRQLWRWASYSQPLVFDHYWHHLVNHAKTCGNKIVQVHGSPPQKGV